MEKNLYSEVDTYWQEKKKEIVKDIDLTIRRNNVDKDLLLLMKAMVETAKIKVNSKEKEE